MADAAIGNGLSLLMTLKDPTMLGKLKDGLFAKMQGSLDDALMSMQCVHYARILPLEGPEPPDDLRAPLSERGVVLLVIEFDGEKKSFLKDLAHALQAPLSELLDQMHGWPVTPSEGDFEADFLSFAEKAEQLETSPFCGYKKVSVKNILERNLESNPLPATPGLDDVTRQKSIGAPFTLVMELDDPLKLKNLLAILGAKENKDRIDAALDSLDYVHFARFLPIFLPPSKAEPFGKSLLLIVTEFDGVMENYVMDFAAALDREFTMIIGYMKGRPLLPVSKYPNEFWGYVRGHLQKPAYFFSSYPGIAVLQIVDAGKEKRLPQAPVVPEVDVKSKQADVQANVLKGIGADRAFHYHLRFQDAESARRFIGDLSVTPAAGGESAKCDTCINIGFTYAGLEAMRLDRSILDAFPEAFRTGAAGRKDQVGDYETSDPRNWSFGREGDGNETGQGRRVHAVVSLHLKPVVDQDQQVRQMKQMADLEKLIEGYGIAYEDRHGKANYAYSGKAINGRLVHFGYRDGISQPHFAGVHEDVNAVPGDFLLGPDLVNSRGGRYIGSLPPALAENATYAAYRVMEQHVEVFDDWLTRTSKDTGEDKEMLAAKLMGRWRNGTPITRYGTAALPANALDQVDLDDFDYASRSGKGDDRDGARCPFGAHIRRFNPRSGMVLGVPWGRLVIRRGLPYTYENESGQASRGLVGMFMCGDLASQFEFLLGVWGRQDLSSFGLQGSQDPMASTSPSGTPFTFTTEKGKQVTVQVPPLTKTIGSLYLFMPGMNGLKTMAASPPAPRSQGIAIETSQTEKPPLLDLASPEFRDDPYLAFDRLRASHPVYKVGGGHNSNWVLSHKLVTEVCDNKEGSFLKPGHNRDPQSPPFGLNGGTDDGLFFMDPPRHTEVRAVMDRVFKVAMIEAMPKIKARNEQLLRTLDPEQKFDLVKDYATALSAGAFMDIMGIPDSVKGLPPVERKAVADWTRAMLMGHDPAAKLEVRGAGGTSSLALRSYLSALAKDQTRRDPKAPTPRTLMEGLRRSACPYVPPALSPDEVTNTASHFALGGYLSTEFLITTGICNLLKHRDQWDFLRKSEYDYDAEYAYVTGHQEKDGHEIDGGDKNKAIRFALWEMLRYDAPFQMADRWVAENCELGGYPLTKGEKVTVVYGSANRDPDVFDRPDLFDITRKPDLTKIYGFGHGIHYCIGAKLGLHVAGMAIMNFIKTFPQADFGPQEAEKGAWIQDPYFRSRVQLMINLVPKKPESSKTPT